MRDEEAAAGPDRVGGLTPLFCLSRKEGYFGWEKAGDQPAG